MSQVDSTNNYATNLLDKMSAEQLCNTVFQADFQSAGRGAYKNSWESNENENLLFSIIICPYILAENQFIISQVVSLSIADYLRSINISAKIKWPNDILVDKNKIAGILIENSIVGRKIKSSVIGIGLNINQKKFDGDFKATSVSILSKNKELNIKEELNSFLSFFEKWLNICRNNKNDEIKSEYFSNLLGSNEYLNYRANNHEFKAIISSIDGFGRLILTNENNEQHIFAFKEVELVL